MIYLMQGSVLELFYAFGQQEVILKHSVEHLIEQERSQIRFLGTEVQAQYFMKIWRPAVQKCSYLAENRPTGPLFGLIDKILSPFKKENERSQEYEKNSVHQHFAYVSDKQELCGLMLMYRQDNPTQWVIGLMKNIHLAPEYRTLMLLSSFDLGHPEASHQVELKPRDSANVEQIEVEDSSIRVKLVSDHAVPSSEFLKTPLKVPLDSSLLQGLLHPIMKEDSGAIEKWAARLTHLVRLIGDNQTTKLLTDPINFSEFSLKLLFKANATLDLIAQHNLTLSFALLKDCLSESGGLRKEIEKIGSDYEDPIKKNLLQMIIVFYEAQVLLQNEDFLQKQVFIKTYSGFLWNNTQINLIPFLLKKKYDLDLFNLVLSEPLYYNSVQMLVSLGYTEEIPEFFANPEKRKILEYIHSLDDINSKKVCLIFWTKSTFSLDFYKRIIKATTEYPLLAETLVVLDQTDKIPIKSLKKLALDPLRHQLQSILHHFGPQLSQSAWKKRDLKQLDVNALSDLTRSLNVLKKVGITITELYHLALKSNNQGQLLRLLLPDFDKISNVFYQRELINILYIGINSGSIHQDKAIQGIKDIELLVLAENLHERFICIKQMQDLGLKKEIIVLAALDCGVKGSRFRKIILEVEAQCKLVHEQLRGSGADREQAKKWQIADKDYRGTLYNLAFDGITKADIHIRERINQAELKVLAIVDPKIQSWLSQVLIIIANIVISVLTLGLANIYKAQKTGNYWFFNQTSLGEQFRALNNEVMDVIDSPEPALPECH